jgi:hypothetical protein
VKKIQVWLKSDKNIGHFTCDMFDNILLYSFWKKRVSDKSCRENQNTHFVPNMFSYKNCTVHKIIVCLLSLFISIKSYYVTWDMS